MSEEAWACLLGEKVVREGEQRVTVKLRTEDGKGVERYSPQFDAYLRVWRARQMQSDKRAAELEREVEQHRRDMRDMGDRKRMHAAQCTREQELQMLADIERLKWDNQQALKKRRLAEVEAARLADADEQCSAVQAENVSLQRKLTVTESHAASLQKQVACMHERLEKRGERVAEYSALKQVSRSLQKQADQSTAQLLSAQDSLAEMEEKHARQLSDVQSEVAASEATCERLASEVVDLQEWKRQRTPLERRKADEALQPRMRRRRHAQAQGRLQLALQDPDLSIKDVAAALEAQEMVDVLFDTRVLWERRLSFAQDLADSMNAHWDVDFTVDFGDEFMLSQRDRDAMRFMLSHDIIGGRPRARLLVSNPHNPRQRVLYPQPLRSRCEWVKRAKEREQAMQLIEHSDDKTCERDFDRSLDELVARDASLLREGPFTSSKPLTFVVSFDGAANFTHVTLRLTDYREGVAAESELKVKQLAVAMGDDHYPRLERIIAPRIGPAASSRATVTLRGEQVPVEGTLCLDLSAARSAYGRRHGKLVHCKCTDVHALFKWHGNDIPRVFEALARWCVENKCAELENDAHSPRQFPFRCRRPGCKHPVIRDRAELARLRAEKAALEADKSVSGKAKLAVYIAAHADLHGQQRPLEPPVTSFEPMHSLIVDLLHGLDLNIPKVSLKYSCMDPAVLTPDMREALGDFFSEIGCPLDIREKADRDASKKWFHGSVWHYDFVLGANRKSYGLYGNIFQLCLLVYGVSSPVASAAAAGTAQASTAAQSGSKKRAAPTGTRARPYRHFPTLTKLTLTTSAQP